jgi:ketosteroid isomerase-like protein
MRTSAGIAVLALLCSGQAFAQTSQDAADVCAMAERHYAAIRAGDTDAVVGQHLPEFTFFRGDGGLLWSPRSHDQQRTEFRERSPSFTSNTSIHHCSAQVHGNTGIATYYLVGSVTIGDNTTTGTWRVTEVWVRQGNAWKEAHHHESRLLGSVSP